MSFLKKLSALREENEKLNEEISFKEYLDKVKKNPKIAKPAHERVYDMITSAGVVEHEGATEYQFFSKELFGLEEPIQTLVDEYFKPSAKRLDVKRRLLLLMGPVSGGKSTIVTMLKKGLEEYSKTEDGAVYAIKGCPMHEEPLNLIPKTLREDFEKEYGVKVEANLCPSCRMRLKEEFGGDIEKFPVQRIVFSEEDRVGIGTFAPSDPKSQDISELTGSIDFSTIGTYGSESDPRAYRFDGELNKANRGLMEFQEMLKCDEKFLWNLLSLTQEGNFKAGRFSLISADELIIAHTNETEYKNFISNKKNEALHSRIIVMKIPYNLKVSQEEKIYQKLIKQSDVTNIHIAPHALWTPAVFSILSRLEEHPKADILKKLYLYDGQEVEGFRDKDVDELKKDAVNEGMFGVDPRYIINRVSTALLKHDKNCINALDVLKAIKDGLDQHASITKEEKEKLLNLISLARAEYDNLAKKEVQKAFVYSYEENAKNLFDNYLDNVEAYCEKHKIVDPITGEDREPDERLMRSIEEQIGISDNAKKAFREEILIRISAFARKGKKFDYETHPRLKEAIEKKLFVDLKDVVKITTSTTTPDENQLKRINEVVKTLVEKHGYCATCANELLQYVGSLLNR